jgi:hypothetical protein
MTYEDEAAAKMDESGYNILMLHIFSERKLTSNARKRTSGYRHHPLSRIREVDWIPTISVFEINLVLHH